MRDDLYFSLFMFTTDLKPADRHYTAVIAGHMQALLKMGYSGFDLPIAPPASTAELDSDLKRYENFRVALEAEGVRAAGFTTNVAATRTYDPSSRYKEQRDLALKYLKSRVDITAALGGRIMAGPTILPYGMFPTTDANMPIWSDQLQHWLANRYRNAQPVFEELAEHAERKQVKVAIEAVDHWETPAPNLVSDVMDFVEPILSPAIGLCVDSAHVALGSDGPGVVTRGIEHALSRARLHYVHLSAPDRGAVHDSWIPWKQFLDPIAGNYTGPYLVEVFNAIPAFLNLLRVTRRKFLIPGEDAPDGGSPDAYTIARKAIEAVQNQFKRIHAATAAEPVGARHG